MKIQMLSVIALLRTGIDLKEESDYILEFYHKFCCLGLLLIWKALGIACVGA